MRKRFYERAGHRAAPGGHSILLDDRPVKTPAGHPLVVPTAAMAQAVADEWNRQGETVDPSSMPLTRLANTACDRVGGARESVVWATAAYAASDLLCHRADGNHALGAREEAEWQPVLDWAGEWLGGKFAVGRGVMPVAQPEDLLGAVRSETAAFDDFALAAFSEMTAVLGSIVLAFAVARGRLGAEEAFRLSQMDETYQEETWGTDAEAARRRELRRADFLSASAFLALARA